MFSGQREQLSNEILVTINPRSKRVERKPDELFSNLRVLIVDEQFYKGLRDKLYERFQSGASVILYEMWVGYGDLMGKTIVSLGTSRMETYKKFLEIGRIQGYGEFGIPLLKTILAGLKSEAYVNLKDSFFASSAGNTAHVECYIVAGMIAGASHHILNKDVVCIEELCLSKGDNACRFSLKNK
jgi:predicted hydrocarbon binding protein